MVHWAKRSSVKGNIWTPLTECVGVCGDEMQSAVPSSIYTDEELAEQCCSATPNDSCMHA